MAAAEWIWPDEALEHDAAAIAAKTAPLLAEDERWVHRRVETVTFVDATRIRRHTSVDFTLPRLEADGAVDYVPLSLVRKGVLTAFDLRDEVSAAVPLLTRQETAEVAASLLAQQAEETLAELGGGTLLPAVEEGLRAVAGARDIESGEPAPPGSPEDAQWAALLGDPWFGALVLDLAEHFVLLVPLVPAPLGRRVLKFEYEQTLEGAGTASQPRLDAVLVSLGLRPYRCVIALSALFDAESYHVEVVAPAEVAIGRARLARDDGAVLDERVHAARAHLYAPRETRGSGAWGVVELRLSLRRALVWPVFLTAAATSAILAAGLAASAVWDVEANEAGAAGLAVALPAFLAPFVTPGGHGLVRRLFQGLRALVVASGLLAFAAAGALQLTLSDASTARAWAVLLVASLGLTAVALVSLVRAAPSS